MTFAPTAPGNDVVVWRDGQAFSRALLAGAARRLSERLTKGTFVINACGDRYNFLVGFLAAALRETITLLPGDRSPGVLATLAKQYGPVCLLTDSRQDSARAAGIEELRVDAHCDQAESGEAETISDNQLAAILFTSGTTGTPTPHPKRWGALRAQARICSAYMGIRAAHPTLHPTRPPAIVATVPPQHMYGLETSILTPLFEAASVHSGRPLLPAEIAAALSSVAPPRILVTTPYHLRALARARLVLPPLAAVVSATAPLTASLAARIEELFSTPVLEIYGCTEVGAVATRRTVEGETWQCHPDLRLHANGVRCAVQASHLENPVPLPDVVRVLTPRSFDLCSRGSDLVDVAGKRASLSGLNTILTEIEGVIDGVFFQPERRDVEAVSRLIAIVVAPDVSKQSLRDRLRARVDPAFLPRRIYYVDALPRCEAGKLPQAALVELARRLGVGGAC